jgi:hypothetical protein
MDESVSVSQAAHALNRSERTIRRKCESGKLKARLVSTPAGREWRIEAAAIGQPAANGAANGAATIHEEITSEAPDIGQPAAITAATDLARIESDVQQIKAFLAGQQINQATLNDQIKSAVVEAFTPLSARIDELVTELEAATAPPPARKTPGFARRSWRFWEK